MITIIPERIPKIELKSYGVDDWCIECEGRIIARNLSEYMARMLAAAPSMLEFLSRFGRTWENSPVKIPVDTILQNCGIKVWRPGDGS